MKTETLCGKKFSPGTVEDANFFGDVASQCPTCGRKLYAEDDAVHDGYRGSPHAHNGAGSSGLADHHFWLVCPECADCACTLCKTGLTEDELDRVVDYHFLTWASEARGAGYTYPDIRAVYEYEVEGGFLYLKEDGGFARSEDFIPEIGVKVRLPVGKRRTYTWVNTKNYDKEKVDGLDWTSLDDDEFDDFAPLGV